MDVARGSLHDRLELLVALLCDPHGTKRRNLERARDSWECLDPCASDEDVLEHLNAHFRRRFSSWYPGGYEARDN